jgi:hypothetical protein
MKWAFRIFLALYAIALMLYLVSVFGLFGQDRDPLGGIFLLPLGLPWNLAARWFGSASSVFVALSPLVNVAILYWLARRKAD